VVAAFYLYSYCGFLSQKQTINNMWVKQLVGREEIAKDLREALQKAETPRAGRLSAIIRLGNYLKETTHYIQYKHNKTITAQLIFF